jgi:hypothetical protein
MRRSSLVTALAVLLVAGLMVPAAALVPQPVLPGVSVTTDNVEHVGYIADVGPSVSARVVEVGEQKRLYVSSIGRGLSIYDVTDPPNPELLGALPIPGFQNEDLAVSADGDLALLSFGDVNQRNFAIDTSDPTAPALASVFPNGDHTLECANPECTHAYGDSGRTYDLTDPTSVQVVTPGWADVMRSQGVNFSQGAHAVVRDASGLVTTDTVPRVMMDPREDPTQPTLVTVGPVPARDRLAYQHNNLRPRADEHQPRTEENADEPGLLPGELLLANGETNLRPRCNGGSGSTDGPFATWSVKGFDEGEEMRPLDVFRPLDNGNYADGNPAVNALGCSGHWFDWSPDGDDYIVPAAWFEHGVRFLHVEGATGAISELGFFQPINGSVGATYWIDDEHVYTTDYVRGIDILRFDRDAEPASQEELDANWLANLNLPTLPQTAAEQYLCRLATEPQ